MRSSIILGKIICTEKLTTTPTTTTTKKPLQPLCEGLELEHFSKSIVRRLKYLN